MTSLVTSSSIPHPSLHEHLLWILPHLLDTHHGSRLHSATPVGSAVPYIHCYFVHMDRLQDHLLSRGKYYAVRGCLYRHSVESRRSLLPQQHLCSHSPVFSSAAYGCGSIYSCATFPTKHAATMRTKSTIHGALSRLRGFLNPKPSPCVGLPSFSAYFCRRSTTQISFSQPSASWLPHSRTTSWAHLAPSLEKLSVLLRDTPLLKLVLRQSLVCYVTHGQRNLLFASQMLTINRR
jgi:hypothetical protein